MYRIRTPHAAVAVLLLGLLPVCAARAEEVVWRTEYDKARAEALEKNRPIVIDFGTENCFWCKKLDASTFRDPHVVATLNERFIPLRIDADKEPALAQYLRIESYPTVVLASCDGRVLQKQVGFVEASPFMEMLQRILSTQSIPDWMVRDYDLATKAIAGSDYPRAIALLRNVIEDGQERAVQVKARAALKELESLAQGRLARARQLVDKGQTTEAMENVTELVRLFPGTQAAGEGGKMLTSLATAQETQVNHRTKRARELLALAKEDYRTQEYLTCLNRCNLVVNGFADLPEGLEAAQLAAEIKGNPEWLRTACDSLKDQLTSLSLSQAEAWLKKGNPQQAIACLEQVVQSFPNSRQAEIAQVRLSQIQGQPTRPVNFKTP